jgi:hypothetical protein
LLVAMLVAAPVAFLVWTGRRSHIAPGADGSASSAATGPASSRVQVPADPAPLWGGATAAVVAAAAVVAGSLAVSRVRRRKGAAVVWADRGVAIATGVAETIDDVRREPDARRAVIGAYVRMERLLTRLGSPRRPSSTPFEYLSQALSTVDVPAGPARTLTELYEVARFSRRNVDAATKARAIDALLAVQRSLVGADA